MKNDRTQRHNTDDIEAMKGLLTEEERKDLIIEETKKSIEFKPIIPLDDSAGSAVPAFPVESLPGAVQDFVLGGAGCHDRQRGPGRSGSRTAEEGQGESQGRLDRVPVPLHPADCPLIGAEIPDYA